MVAVMCGFSRGLCLFFGVVLYLAVSAKAVTTARLAEQEKGGLYGSYLAE